MNTICIDPLNSPLWQRLIDRDQSSVFHSAGWMRVLAETYNLPVQAFVMLDSVNEPVAGIPFCRIADAIGERIVTLPFSDYCDPLVDDHGQWNYLIDQLLVEHSTVVLRCLHNDLPCADRRLTLIKQAKWHGLDLQPDIDTLWCGLPDPTRRAIEKARRDDVVVRMAEHTEELRAFFELHLKIRKYKYHLLAQPYRFFENIWRHFIEPHNGALMVAIHHGEIIGGVLFLEWRDRLYYKFNASASNHLAHRPNDLLIWEGIQFGKARGRTFLDFGLSDWNQEGLVRYKRKFASEEKAISFLRYVPDGATNQQEQRVRDLLTRLTDLFTDESVPDQVTDKAGEVLYRFFM